MSALTYTLDENELLRLRRAQHAAELLSALDNDASNVGVISRDSLAAIAEYVAEDIGDVLTRVEKRYRDEHRPATPQPGPSRSAP